MYQGYICAAYPSLLAFNAFLPAEPIMSYDHILLACFAFVLLVTYMLSKRRRSSLPLPPSPKAHPLLGHLLSFPSSDQHIAYRDIGVQLNSDIISFNVFGLVVVALNSIESATDLFAKRAMIYSNPIELPMLNDERLLGWGKETSSIRYEERWKQQRKLTQSALHPSAAKDLRATMVKQARTSVHRLLRNPDNIASELQWLTAANILSSVYGYQPSYPSDDLVDVVKIASSRLGEATRAGNFYVNIIPWMKYIPSWFPGASWKRKAKKWRAEKDRMVNEPFEWTKSQIAEGVASPSILKNLLTGLERKEKIDSEEETVIRWATGALFAAGADTIDAALMTFVLAMVLHPEVQRKVQVELDAVLGEERLPELSDRESLPYMSRVVKEVLRWNSVAPLGIPHICAQDDEYKGYMIPKGAIVIGNVWAISNNPSIYPEPRSFNPDRFLDTSVPDPPAFGFGRRVCPGSHFAEASLFIVASTLLTIFNLTPTLGKPMPEARFTLESLASHPAPFSCTLAPRSEKRQHLLEQCAEV